MFIEHEVLTDITRQHISHHLSRAATISPLQWNWIWNTIGGQNAGKIFDADSLFNAIRENNVTGLNLAEPGLLPPPVVVCSLRRLLKVEQVFCSKIKVNPKHCLAFKYSQIWC